MAEVDMAWIADDTEWPPYPSLEDAYRLDDVREALRRGDIAEAAKIAWAYRFRPVSSQGNR
ncbi:MAG: hypothetical protein D6819_09600 [Gammaproteobacteria bacterium]|nr:MAG: hypothetical protein D6819_09600 [Gammaproteobacteria bacterium]